MGNRQSRAGGRQDRNKLLGQRKPRLGHYLIITDTEETEKNYFKGLRDSLPKDIQKYLVIEIYGNQITQKLVAFAKEKLENSPNLAEAWIIFDKDERKDFDSIIEDANKKGINVGWSNPCFEIWFLAYFRKRISCSGCNDSKRCCEEFLNQINKEIRKGSKKEYSDIDAYKNDKEIYKKLEEYGDISVALEFAKKQYEKVDAKKPSAASSVTTVYQLVEEIRNKTVMV